MSASSQHTDQMIDHLFRHQSGKMVAVLTHLFGIANLQLAEDVVQESFVQALQLWKLRGIPDQPEAWLMQVAKNKAIDLLRRKELHQRFTSSQEAHSSENIDAFFHPQEMADSQLRMVFACCHPSLKEEDQVALTLKLVFAFSINEIARALLGSETNIQKRILRAKSSLRNASIQLEIPAGKDLVNRSTIVHTILYLLFNEGYSSTKADEPIRYDLCMEAMRCTKLLVEHPLCRQPEGFALLALMCFHAARFNSRINEGNELVLLQDQDRTKWDYELIGVGRYYLGQSASGNVLSQYHIEAVIAAEYALASSYATTNWHRLLELFELLIPINPSPVVVLNRAVILAQTGKPEEAIASVLSIPGIEILLRTNHLYGAVLGDLYLKMSNRIKASTYFQQAKSITRSLSEQQLIQLKLDRIANN